MAVEPIQIAKFSRNSALNKARRSGALCDQTVFVPICTDDSDAVSWIPSALRWLRVHNPGKIELMYAGYLKRYSLCLHEMLATPASDARGVSSAPAAGEGESTPAVRYEPAGLPHGIAVLRYCAYHDDELGSIERPSGDEFKTRMAQCCAKDQESDPFMRYERTAVDREVAIQKAYAPELEALTKMGVKVVGHSWHVWVYGHYNKMFRGKREYVEKRFFDDAKFKENVLHAAGRYLRTRLFNTGHNQSADAKLPIVLLDLCVRYVLEETAVVYVWGARQEDAPYHHVLYARKNNRAIQAAYDQARDAWAKKHDDDILLQTIFDGIVVPYKETDRSVSPAAGAGAGGSSGSARHRHGSMSSSRDGSRSPVSSTGGRSRSPAEGRGAGAGSGSEGGRHRHRHDSKSSSKGSSYDGSRSPHSGSDGSGSDGEHPRGRRGSEPVSVSTLAGLMDRLGPRAAAQFYVEVESLKLQQGGMRSKPVVEGSSAHSKPSRDVSAGAGATPELAGKGVEAGMAGHDLPSSSLADAGASAANAGLFAAASGSRPTGAGAGLARLGVSKDADDGSDSASAPKHRHVELGGPSVGSTSVGSGLDEKPEPDSQLTAFSVKEDDGMPRAASSGNVEDRLKANRESTAVRERRTMSHESRASASSVGSFDDSPRRGAGVDRAAAGALTGGAKGRHPSTAGGLSPDSLAPSPRMPSTAASAPAHGGRS